jgi:dihydrofolate reductase
MLQVRTRPTFSDRTSPLASSTWRCWTTAGSDIVSGRASSLTEAGPRLNRSTIRRRLGSASAWNIRSSWGLWLSTSLTILSAMGLVLWHVTMSLDGFIAGPGDAMEWVFENPEPNALAEEVVETTGALVVGRRTYEVEDRYRGGFYGGGWSGPFFVLTHEPPEEVPEWMTGEFVTDGIESVIARAKSAAGEKNVVVLGADVARQCIEHGLLDEILVHLAPVLLGDGIRLYEDPAARRVDLERVSLGKSGQLTDLRFRRL